MIYMSIEKIAINIIIIFLLCSFSLEPCNPGYKDCIGYESYYNNEDMNCISCAEGLFFMVIIFII